jgi:hypothetical protein
MENDIASNYKIGTRRFANLLWESKTNSLVRKNPRYSKVAERYSGHKMSRSESTASYTAIR